MYPGSLKRGPIFRGSQKGSPEISVETRWLVQGSSSRGIAALFLRVWWRSGGWEFGIKVTQYHLQAHFQGHPGLVVILQETNDHGALVAAMCRMAWRLKVPVQEARGEGLACGKWSGYERPPPKKKVRKEWRSDGQHGKEEYDLNYDSCEFAIWYSTDLFHLNIF